jgi:hypothetical protein
MADQPEPGPSSRRRPTDNPGRVPDLATRENPMETEESESEKSKVKLNKFQQLKLRNLTFHMSCITVFKKSYCLFISCPFVSLPPCVKVIPKP